MDINNINTKDTHLPDYPEGEEYIQPIPRVIPENIKPTGQLNQDIWTETYENKPFTLQPTIDRLIGKTQGFLAKRSDKYTPEQLNIEKEILDEIHGNIEITYEDLLEYINTHPNIVQKIKDAFILQNTRMGRSDLEENIDKLDKNNYIVYLAEILLDPGAPDYTFEKYNTEESKQKIEDLLKGRTVYGGKKKYKTRKNRRSRILKRGKKSRRRQKSKRNKKSRTNSKKRCKRYKK